MILHQTRGPNDWISHLAKGEKHWQPGFSAMETAHAWEAARPGLPPEVQALFPDALLLQAVVEYPVPLPGGRTDSMNDVFALLSGTDGLTVCMVEAKRNEPFGDTLQDWLSDGSPGKKERLRFICESLGLETDRLPPTIRYQLLHRTASAVLTAHRYHARQAVMLVQSFSPEKRWFDDFAAFVALFGVAAKAEHLVEAMPRVDGLRLSLGWVNSPIKTE